MTVPADVPTAALKPKRGTVASVAVGLSAHGHVACSGMLASA
jgi:hypothetical protein